MPFFAEEMYQGLKTKDMPESVHLCEWPKTNEKVINKDLEKEMDTAREVVTIALAKRAELGLRVRQPLAKLTVKAKISQKFFELIADEVNVKKVEVNEKSKQDIEFDAEITPKLKQEGQVREIVRHIQDLRKKAGLTPQDKDITVYYSGDNDLVKIIKKNEKQIKETTKSKHLKPAPIDKEKQEEFTQKKEVEIDGKQFLLALNKK